MRELVRDETYEGFVSGKHSWSCERKSWILHPSVRKRWRKNEKIVPSPAIRSVKFFRCGYHFVDFCKFIRGAIDTGRLRIDAGGLSNRAKRDVAHSKREEVGRNRVRHPEAIHAQSIRILFTIHSDMLGAHHSTHASGNVHGCVVGLPDSRTILRGNPRPRENRFSLREQERHLSARSLLRGQPLHCSCSG